MPRKFRYPTATRSFAAVVISMMMPWTVLAAEDYVSVYVYPAIGKDYLEPTLRSSTDQEIASAAKEACGKRRGYVARDDSKSFASPAEAVNEARDAGLEGWVLVIAIARDGRDVTFTATLSDISGYSGHITENETVKLAPASDSADDEDPEILTRKTIRDIVLEAIASLPDPTTTPAAARDTGGSSGSGQPGRLDAHTDSTAAQGTSWLSQRLASLISLGIGSATALPLIGVGYAKARAATQQYDAMVNTYVNASSAERQRMLAKFEHDANGSEKYLAAGAGTAAVSGIVAWLVWPSPGSGSGDDKPARTWWFEPAMGSLQLSGTY